MFYSFIKNILNIIKTFLFYTLIEILVNYSGNKTVITFSSVYFFYLSYYYFFNKKNKNDNNKINSLVKEEDIKDIKDIKDNEFVLCFRKTRIEDMIISRIEDISKTRDIQFVISFFYYKNDRSIKGSIYIITSKVVYKLFFIKNNLICHEHHTFDTFVSKSNIISYNYIKNFLNKNDNCKEKSHHTEFYTWPYYYFTNNYDLESKNIEKFLNSL